MNLKRVLVVGVWVLVSVLSGCSNKDEDDSSTSSPTPKVDDTITIKKEFTCVPQTLPGFTLDNLTINQQSISFDSNGAANGTVTFPEGALVIALNFNPQGANSTYSQARLVFDIKNSNEGLQYLIELNQIKFQGDNVSISDQETTNIKAIEKKNSSGFSSEASTMRQYPNYQSFLTFSQNRIQLDTTPVVKKLGLPPSGSYSYEILFDCIPFTTSSRKVNGTFTMSAP